MDRRKFLKTTALAGAAGAAALGSASCSSLKFLSTGSAIHNQPDMSAYIYMMDQGMHQISDWNPVDEFTGTVSDSPSRSEVNRLARNAYKSLYVTAMFSDLSPDDQLHPGVQARVLKSLPEMQLAAMELDDFLKSDDAVQADDLREFLNQKDDPGTRFIAQFDGQARDTGVADSRCSKTRDMASEMVWRMKNQPPDLVMDEVNAKMRKLEASEGNTAAVEHFVATKVSEEAFWRWQEMQAADDPAQEDVPDTYFGWTTSEEDDSQISEKPDSQKDDEKKKEKTLAQRGAKKMGIGLAILGVSAIAVAAGGWPGVFSGTVGAIFFLVGLIQLIAAGISGGDASPSPA